jgi:plastocyanin
MPRHLRSAVTVAVLLLVASACSSDTSSAVPPAGTTSTSASSPTTTESAPASGEVSETIKIGSETANFKGNADVSGKTSLEIELDNDGSEYYFKPTVVSGDAGSTISVELKNEGSVPHTFTSDDLGVDETVQPGATADVDVTFPGSGTAVYFCSFHRALGMLGELKVA